MARLLGLLLAVSGAVGAAPFAVAAPPSCSSLPAPFPCGTGTHQVCTKQVKCYGTKPGLVPQLLGRMGSSSRIRRRISSRPACNNSFPSKGVRPVSNS